MVCGSDPASELNRWDQFRLFLQLLHVVLNLDKSLVTMFIGGVIGILAFTCYAVLRGGWGNTAAQAIGVLVVPAIVAGIVGPFVTTLIAKFPALQLPSHWR